MTNEEAQMIICTGKYHPWIEKCAYNNDIIIVLIKGKTFVHFWRTIVTQEEETFEGAMHKFYY